MAGNSAVSDIGRKKEEFINRKENENLHYRNFISCFSDWICSSTFLAVLGDGSPITP